MSNSNEVDNETLLINEVLLGNRSAISFCNMVFDVSQTWDDLIDRDKPISDTEINRAFRNALIEIPMNEFYQNYAAILVPKMDVFISDWLDANEIEKSGGDMLIVSHVLRDSVSSLLIHCAEIVGGYEHARSVALKVRKFVHTETFKKYKEDLRST